MKPYHIVLIVIGGILLLFIILSFIIAWGSYKYALKHKPILDKKDNIDCGMVLSNDNGTPVEREIRDLILLAVSPPHEDVYVKSKDGLRLHGVLYRFGDENSPLGICFHGFRGNKFRDFCGGLQILRQAGCNVILVDQRSHNESEGRYLTFGAKESEDVLCWVNKGIELYGNKVKIAIQGISMGAATVLMAAAFRPLPDNVKCVIADCPFSSPFSIFEFSEKTLHIPAKVVDFYSGLTGLLFCGVNFAKYDLLKGLKNNKLPILMLHGQKDSIVPTTNSVNMKERYPDMIQLELFPNADHGMSYFDGKERYINCCLEFLKKNVF